MTLHPVNRALALALAVVALPAFWPAPTADLPAPISGKHPDDVRVIELTQADSRLSIRLDRIDDRWELTAPVSVPADPVTVAGPLLGVLRSPSRARYTAEQVAPDKIGLVPPRWQVRFDDLVVQFGDTDPSAGLRYVRVNGTIHRIDDVDPALFDADYADLVSRKLIPAPQHAAAVTTADGEVGQETIAAWNQARAVQVRRATRADFDDSRAGIEVMLGNGDRLRFRSAQTPSALILVRPALDLAYVLPASAQTELLPPGTAGES